jgi:pimeloyl-ACP methyl ester carboxylesterase
MALPGRRGLLGALSIAAFTVAVLVAGPDVAAPLVARPALGAGIAADGQAAPIALAPARVHPGADLRIDEFYVHIPAGAPEPLTVVVALHGMGGSGEDTARPLLPRTDAEHLVVVAPTYNYGNWQDPAQLTREATTQLPRIAAFLDQLPDVTGMSVKPGALLYGFSRGAQTANRFALAFPEHVAGVAMVSAGTYTLPFASLPSNQGDVAMPFPYGIANCADLFGHAFDTSRFASVPFWVAVGSGDTDPADVPHQWDRYIGDDRVERAQRFTGLLKEAGVDAQDTVFAGVGHGETDQIRTAAIDFLVNANPA